MDIKYVFLGFILTVIVAWCLILLREDQAFIINTDNLKKRLYVNHLIQANQYFPKFNGLKNRLRKNIGKDVDTFLEVISDVRWVRISKTIDTRNYVIEFTSADSLTQASLWLDSNNEVDSISPY